MKNILFLSREINRRCAIKLDAVYTAAKARGWTVHEAEFGWTALDIADIVASLKPDGAIFEGAHLVESVDLRPLNRVPTVYLDTDFPAPRGMPTVRSDAAAIADLAADELIASKPAEAAFFSLMPGKRWSRLRAARFRARMRKEGIPFRVLDRAAVNDISAAELLRGAANCGLDCPRDFTLVSVDNETLFCENASPKVSSIEQNIARAGVAAVEALDSLLRGRTGRHKQVLVPPKGLVRRASSVRPLAHTTTAQRVAAFIDAHALEAIGIADIAAALGCSRRTVETHYRAMYGQSLGEAILARRFAEVERLLASPDQALEPIANLCGWKSPAHLMRSFKRRYGMTMSKWRKVRGPPITA